MNVADKKPTKTPVVTARPQRMNKIAGPEKWIAELSRSIDSIGTDDFPVHLIDALKSLVNFDYSVIFAFHQSEKKTENDAKTIHQTN